jgi:hypothetical protein
MSSETAVTERHQLAKFDSGYLGTVTKVPAMEPHGSITESCSPARLDSAGCGSKSDCPLGYPSPNRNGTPIGRVFRLYSLNSNVKRELGAPLNFFTSN